MHALIALIVNLVPIDAPPQSEFIQLGERGRPTDAAAFIEWRKSESKRIGCSGIIKPVLVSPNPCAPFGWGYAAEFLSTHRQ